MRGVSYEEKRDRWRCFHVSGARTFQPRFPSEREAFWKKIELCADDGVFLFSKSVKEGNKNAQSSKTGISNLPVGIREHFSKSRNRWRVIAHLPNGDVDQDSTKELLERLFEKTEVALQIELNQCFKESANCLSH